MVNPQVTLTNRPIKLSVVTQPSSNITLIHNKPILAVSSKGIQGPVGETGGADMTGTWLGLVTGWSSAPMLIDTIADGQVWEYNYSGGITYYRLVPTGSGADAFYSTFSGGVLSDLVVAKGVVF